MISGWGIFLIFLFLIGAIAAVGWIGYSQLRARRLGLPPPSLNPFAAGRNNDTTSNYRTPAPAPGGIQGWVVDKWNQVRHNTRSNAGGAYESTGYDGARRGFGPLDPDEAWDARVDHEASGYYEEQEIGLQDTSHGPYGGSGYGNVGISQAEEGRGRSKSAQRQLDDRYEEEVHGGGRRANPFGDEAEPSNISLRAVSPRPHGEDRPKSAHKKGGLSVGGTDGSPTERRSMFHEEM